MLVVWGLAAYLTAGAVAAACFVLFGAGRALGYSVAITPGGRAMLFPGALALWPVVLWRWLR